MIDIGEHLFLFGNVVNAKNKSVLEATGASEEQMASYTRMYEAMAKIQGHTNNLVLLLDVLGEKAGDNDNE